MVISEKFEFVYLDIPKTGSYSLDIFFQKNYGAVHKEPALDSNLSGKHGREIPEWAKSYTKIVSVRNPYERICSLYNFMKTQDGSILGYYGREFDTFLDTCLGYVREKPNNEKLGLTYRMFPAWKFLAPIGYDIVIKQETLLQDVQKLYFVGDTLPSMPSLNTNASNNGWASLYSEDRAEKIREWAGIDFELFGYDRDYKG